MRVISIVRPISTGLLAVVGMALGGCASYPAGQQSVPISGEAQAVQFNTGRVTVYLTGMDGRPLFKAMVNVESAGRTEDYFRTMALTDEWGRVTFNGLPQEVRISAYHAETQGSYSRVFSVPSAGLTEVRMLVEPQ